MARHRTRGPNTPWPATLAHARSAALQQGVDRLARHVVVDQHLGQSLGQIGRPLDGERVAGQRQAHGRRRVQQHPAAAAAQLVARAVDDQSARCQSPPHRRPRVGHRLVRVLAQHVECANQNRPVARQFETPEREVDARRQSASRRRPGPFAPDRVRSRGRRRGRRCGPIAVASQAPAWSPAARRSPGRRPADRRRPAGQCAPGASARASGRCAAIGCGRWCPASPVRWGRPWRESRGRIRCFR